MEYTFECATVPHRVDHQWQLKDNSHVGFHKDTHGRWMVIAVMGQIGSLKPLVDSGFPLNTPVDGSLNSLVQSVSAMLGTSTSLARGSYTFGYGAVYDIGNTGFAVAKQTMHTVIAKQAMDAKLCWSIIPPQQKYLERQSVKYQMLYETILPCIYDRQWDTRQAALDEFTDIFCSHERHYIQQFIRHHVTSSKWYRKRHRPTVEIG